MPAISRAVGTTSQLLPVFIPDATVSTGAGLANIVASTVVLAWYRNNMTAISSNTLTTGTLGTWNSSTFSQISSTSTLGWYQVSVPDGVFFSGDTSVLHLYGAANMAPVPVLVELTKFNNQNFVSSYVFSSTNTVSTISGSVGVSSLAIPVTVSSGVVSVSSVTIPVGVSSVATPVSASSVTVPVGVSTLTIPVGVSSIALPVGVSSLATPVTVSSNSDKTGYALTSVYDPAKTAAQAGDAMALTAGATAAAADRLLGRNVSSGGDGGRTVLQALYVLRNKVDVSTGIVYATDDTASSWSFAVSTIAGDPIYLIDPT